MAASDSRARRRRSGWSLPSSGRYAVLLALAVLELPKPSWQADRFVLHTFKPLVNARMDPLISPGQIAQHAHVVVGGSNFNVTYDPVIQRQSKCSNMALQADLSNYWTPNIYRVLSNGSYQAMQSAVRVYYEIQAPDLLTETLEPFPEDFRMIVGDPSRKSMNYNDPIDGTGQWWMGFYCDMGSAGPGYGSWTLPTKPCQNIVSKVFFPTCWNGQPFDTNNPRAHVRFPTTLGYDGPTCPDGYKHRIPSVQIETFYYHANEPQSDNDIQYILANGDTTGYGLHGDFANGWNTTVLAGALKDCVHMAVAEPANKACPHFVDSYNETTAQYCMLETQIPDEPVGYTGALDWLPGCNMPWGNQTVKPWCNPKRWQGNPGMVTPEPDLFQWSYWYTWSRRSLGF